MKNKTEIKIEVEPIEPKPANAPEKFLIKLPEGEVLITGESGFVFGLFNELLSGEPGNRIHSGFKRVVDGMSDEEKANFSQLFDAARDDMKQKGSSRMNIEINQKFDAAQDRKTAPVYENAFGCVKCQKYHFESEPEFKDHLSHQSKHGIARREKLPPEEIDRLHAWAKHPEGAIVGVDFAAPEGDSTALQVIENINGIQKTVASVVVSPDERQRAHDAKYPLHAKLRSMKDLHDHISEFAEYLESNGIEFAKVSSHQPSMISVSYDTFKPEKVIADFLGIDPKDLENEKRQMLDEMQKGESNG